MRSRSNRRPAWAWLALLAALGCTRSPAPAAEWPVAKIAFQRVGPYRAFFVAQEKGFFDREQVKVEASEYPSSNVIAQAQASGSIDGSAFISFPVLFALEQNAPGDTSCYLLLPMTQASRFAAVVVAASSPMQRPEDLKGHKLGVYPSSTNVIFARLMLERLFGSPDAAEVIQVDPKNQFELLATGGVDALIGPDPMPATAVARHVGRVLVYSPDARYVMDPMPVGCATFSARFAREHPETVGRVQRAMERAVDYLRDPAHHAEVAAIVARHTGVDEAVGAGLGELDYWKLAEADRPAVQRLADLLEKKAVLTAHVDATRLFPAR